MDGATFVQRYIEHVQAEHTRAGKELSAANLTMLQGIHAKFVEHGGTIYDATQELGRFIAERDPNTTVKTETNAQEQAQSEHPGTTSGASAPAPAGFTSVSVGGEPAYTGTGIDSANAHPPSARGAPTSTTRIDPEDEAVEEQIAVIEAGIAKLKALQAKDEKADGKKPTDEAVDEGIAALSAALAKVKNAQAKDDKAHDARAAEEGEEEGEEERKQEEQTEERAASGESAGKGKTPPPEEEGEGEEEEDAERASGGTGVGMDSNSHEPMTTSGKGHMHGKYGYHQHSGDADHSKALVLNGKRGGKAEEESEQEGDPAERALRLLTPEQREFLELGRQARAQTVAAILEDGVRAFGKAFGSPDIQEAWRASLAHASIGELQRLRAQMEEARKQALSPRGLHVEDASAPGGVRYDNTPTGTGGRQTRAMNPSDPAGLDQQGTPVAPEHPAHSSGIRADASAGDPSFYKVGPAPKPGSRHKR